MNYAVVTGVSRGLGESIAKLFLELGINVVGVSRQRNKKLAEIAEQNNVTFQHFRCDLGNSDNIESIAEQILKQIFVYEPSALYVVNNAASLGPIDQSMHINSSELIRHVNVNTIAPMVFTNLFLKKAHELEIPMVGVTVTSGAANRPIYGWSAYCSTKASINMYTQTAALEQDVLKTGSKVIAFNPGVMDTAMQEEIRSSSYEEFKDVDKYKNFKKSNLLKDTDAVGGVLVDILTDKGNIINGKIYDVKDYL
ncbi:(S)-benzoin forming benzil reductase [Virgibacillus oceani]|uniref:Short-chain dehydrogenase n=1 Tax=Virgibacillus oceani TaxID=1479511 RepID=A0A917HQ48_9BACI|nr:(S)-benzoin forming benzil reductase [Virgibacillus oceani]GGG85547.1 short-chain dehydrogenase [Virgibacillus oceani]